jgi:PAS domain S-box-containing protein
VWNQCATKLVGYYPEEVMGHSLVRKFITKDYQASVQRVLDEALHGKETANFEFPLMTKSDVRLDVLLNATTRRDEQGNVIGMVGIGTNVLCSLWDIPLRKSWVTRLSKNLFDLSTKRWCRMSSKPPSEAMRRQILISLYDKEWSTA